MIAFPIVAVPLQGTIHVKRGKQPLTRVLALFVDSECELWMIAEGGKMLDKLSDDNYFTGHYARD